MPMTTPPSRWIFWKNYQEVILLIWLLYFSFVTSSRNLLQFLHEPTSQLVSTDDERAVFKCSAIPATADIQWLHNGRLLSEGMDDHIRISQGKLVVRLPKDEDSSLSLALQGGQYQCIARHKGLAIISKPAKLLVAELDSFPTKDNVHVDVSKGNTAVIPCTPPFSTPTVVTEFEFEGIKIDKTKDRYRLMPSGDLQIFNAHLNDSGIYHCTAHNPYTGQKKPAPYKVFLKVRETSHHRRAQLVAVPRSTIEVVTGSNITLECAANGEPVPNVTWTRQNGNLPPLRHRQIGGNLLLFNVRRSDEGTYLCHASNEVGTPAVTATYLDIQEVPQIIRPPLDKHVTEGDNIILECVTKGKPRPIVMWYHNGVRLRHNSHVTVKDGKLILQRITKRHSGFYQCFAGNELEDTHATAYLTVVLANGSFYDPSTDYFDEEDEDPSLSFESNEMLPPFEDDDAQEGVLSTDIATNTNSASHGSPRRKKNKKKGKGVKMVPPTRPEVTRLSDDSVMVRWNVPQNDGLPIMFFKVQYKDIGKRGEQWMTIDEDIAPHIHSYAVSGLNAGGKYRFRIAAVYSNNDNKLGPNSSKFILYKDPPMKKPIRGPTIVHAEPISPSAITLHWEYDDLDLVPIEGFFIHYCATHTAGDYLKITVLGANTRSHIISHLLPETAYDIKMQCFNVAGTSEFSNIYTSKTLASEDSASKSHSSRRHDDSEYPVKPMISTVQTDDNSSSLPQTVIGASVGALIVVFTAFSILYLIKFIKHRQCARRDSVTENVETEDKDVDDKGAANGRAMGTNGYIPRYENLTIRVNPFEEHQNSEEKLSESIVSNNNETIPLATVERGHAAENLSDTKSSEECDDDPCEQDPMLEPGTEEQTTSA